MITAPLARHKPRTRPQQTTMTLERLTLLNKIEQYLNDSISSDEVHAWVLQIAVSDTFAEIAKADPLLKEAVEALLEIHQAGVKEVPTKKAIEYYRRCLTGQEKFIPLKERRDWSKLNIPDEVGRRISPAEKRRIRADRFFVFLRGYVVLFGLTVLAVYAISFFQPGFLGLSEGQTRQQVPSLETLLHVLYAAIVIMPLRLTAKGFFFYAAFPVLAIGMLYFWAVPFRLFHNLVLIVLALPASALPATLAVVLLAWHKERSVE
jgi:hypothetical protein